MTKPEPFCLQVPGRSSSRVADGHPVLRREEEVEPEHVHLRARHQEQPAEEERQVVDDVVVIAAVARQAQEVGRDQNHPEPERLADKLSVEIPPTSPSWGLSYKVRYSCKWLGTYLRLAEPTLEILMFSTGNEAKNRCFQRPYVPLVHSSLNDL